MCLPGGTWFWAPGKAGGWAGLDGTGRAVSPGAGLTGGPTNLSPTWGAVVLAPELESDANGAVQLLARLPGLRLDPAWAMSKPDTRLPPPGSPLEIGLPCVPGLGGDLQRARQSFSLWCTGSTYWLPSPCSLIPRSWVLPPGGHCSDNGVPSVTAPLSGVTQLPPIPAPAAGPRIKRSVLGALQPELKPHRPAGASSPRPASPSPVGLRAETHSGRR